MPRRRWTGSWLTEEGVGGRRVLRVLFVLDPERELALLDGRVRSAGRVVVVVAFPRQLHLGRCRRERTSFACAGSPINR